MLNNVLDQCNYEHASMPIEVLSSYSKYRRERYALQHVVIIGMLVLFLLLPLLFISPKLRLAQVSDGRLQLTVDAVLPVTSVTARLNGKNVAIYDSGNGQYVLKPTTNGELQVAVTLLNRQMTAISYTVADVDTTAPAYVASAVSDGMLTLTFEDTESGIDPESVQAVAGEDETPVQLTFDEAAGQIVMPYPTEIVDLYVADKAGNILHVMLTPQ